MTIITLDYLTRQGEPDRSRGFQVDGSKHLELPVLDEVSTKIFNTEIPQGSLTEEQLEKGEKCFFYEVSRHNKKEHIAICIRTPFTINVGDGFKSSVDLYLVWIAPEKVWIAFYYADAASMEDSYGSTVSTSPPCIIKLRLFLEENRIKNLLLSS